jgi:hypothetical protein
MKVEGLKQADILFVYLFIYLFIIYLIIQSLIHSFLIYLFTYLFIPERYQSPSPSLHLTTSILVTTEASPWPY